MLGGSGSGGMGEGLGAGLGGFGSGAGGSGPVGISGPGAGCGGMRLISDAIDTPPYCAKAGSLARLRSAPALAASAWISWRLT